MRLCILFTMALTMLSFAETGVQKVNGSNYTSIPISAATTGRPYRIVIMGDGFKDTEQAAFNTAVDNIANHLRTQAPFAANACALQLYRINVASKDSGVDHPSSSPVVAKDTYLNVRFGNPGEATRCITSDTPEKIMKTASLAPGHDYVLVIANDAEYGGCYTNGITFTSTTNASIVAAHEFGHQIGGLADEYACYLCDGTDDNRPYTGAEPAEVNVTTDARRTNPKWGPFVNPVTAIPTTTPPAAATELGFRAGGLYFASGIYRSEDTCMMRDAGRPFCVTCTTALGARLDSRCGECAVNPVGLPCIISKLQKDFQIRYPLPRWQPRWPIPYCLRCPFISPTDRFEYILKGAGLTASLRVVDSAGRVLATATASRNGTIAINWSGARSTEYWIELDTGGPLQPTTLRSELKRNGVRQNLP